MTTPRLRRSNPAGPGLTRRRVGRGWAYLDATGARVTDPDVLARMRALAIPPAWTNVWICPDPYGHIQAVGIDSAGRRQYIYHQVWRENQDRVKFQRMVTFGGRLPALRRRWRRDLARPDLDRDRVLAAAATLLDLGLFRVGGEEYAHEHGTYGLATLRRDHVHIRRGVMIFDFRAKAGIRRIEMIDDPAVREVVERLRRRRDEHPELFAYRRDGRWYDLRSGTINEYLREMSKLDVTAKYFRTWHATALMAVNLAEHVPVPPSVAARRRIVSRGYVEVSEALGNTPAVCKRSYVDPRVVDRYNGGETIDARRIRGNGRPIQASVEREVIRLLTE